MEQRNVLLILGLAALMAAGAPANTAGPAGPYQPTKKSLNKHEVPDWYNDAKFGIFIHWSLASVPAFAPVTDREIWQIGSQEGIEAQLKYNPYTEWYLNTMQIEGSPTRKYHLENYGADFSYFDFAKTYNQEVKKWDPAKWAETFKRAGAKYVVLVTKHHDGFLLWPSERPNPFHENYYASRDLVGELTREVKAEGMRMGFYYSGGLDWTFQAEPLVDAASYLTNGPATKEYADYVDFHWKELIDRYGPSILWNDICYPPDGNEFGVMAYFYNRVPEGVVNDRWTKLPKHGRKAMTSWPLRQVINWVGNRIMTSEGLSTPKPPHCDFVTPEYAVFKEIRTGKWECTRGIGYSFGYNRMEEAEDYMKAEEAVRLLIDIVSKNGNLLLNVGPRIDGSIPQPQLDCILGMGRWLASNGEAIYGTRPWERAEGRTSDGIDVRFTRKGDTVYAILLDTPKGGEVTIEGLSAQPGAKVRMLEPGVELSWKQVEAGLSITLPEPLPPSPAHTIAVEMGG